MSNKIPEGFCQCGCGQRTSIVKQNIQSRGLMKGSYYKYVYRHKARDNDPNRFWSKVKIGKPDECWEWQASRFKNEYGSLRWNGKTGRSNRVAYELTHGQIPDRLEVCHTCDNPPCCNPNHLFIGTRADNIHDRVEKGRSYIPKGEENSHAKLTEKQVDEIRILYATGTVRVMDLAKKYQIHRSQIYKITHKIQWQ